MALISEKDLSIRKMEDADGDYQLMLKWLSDNRVAEHYGGTNRQLTLANIKVKYGRKIREFAYTTPCIIERDGQPVGYLQFYETSKEEVNGKEPPLWLQPGAYNIDMFIGQPQLWNQGIGSTVLQFTAKYLLKNGATAVTIDPKTTNERAIHAYEKAGFKKVQILPQWEEQEGKWHDNWLMSYQAVV